MKIYNYYLEIKNRSVLLLSGWVATVLVSYTYKEILLLLVLTKQNTSLIAYTNEMFYFIFTNVTEIFAAYIILIFFMTNQITVLYLCYHIFIFITLGLYKAEYNYLGFIFKICLFVLFFSIIIFNKVLLSFSWDFFLSFQNFATLKSLTLHFETKLSEYLDFYIKFHYTCIIYFQIFSLLVLFFDNFKDELLKMVKCFRKFLYYCFVIFSTVMTPPDVFSQIILSFGIIFICEILIFYFTLRKILIR